MTRENKKPEACKWADLMAKDIWNFIDQRAKLYQVRREELVETFTDALNAYEQYKEQE